MKATSQNDWIQLAIAGVLAAGALAAGTASATAAADEGKEQCAGIARGGQNDCATSRNECHGHVQADGDRDAWIYLPAGTCERIVGGRVVHVKDPTPANKRQ